jgi:hypothetical protein
MNAAPSRKRKDATRIMDQHGVDVGSGDAKCDHPSRDVLDDVGITGAPKGS